MSSGHMLRGPAIALVAMAGLWALLAPVALGGWMSYVAIEGTSMQPELKTGDLVVVRRQTGYAPGDVVAYWSSLGDALVLHRIVDTDGDRFVVKGDNNEFIDLDRPAPSDILGRQVMAVPGAASAFAALGRPAAVVGLLAAAVGVVALGIVAGGRRRDRRRRNQHLWQQQPWTTEGLEPMANDHEQLMSSPAPPPLASSGSTGSGADRSDLPAGTRWSAPRVVGTPLVWVMVTAVMVTLAAIAWMTPVTTIETELSPYVVGLTFDYQTQLPPNPVYGDGGLRTGDTVFAAVVDAIDMRVSSDVVSADSFAGRSQLQLSVEVSSSAGWKRQLAASSSPVSSGPVTAASIVADFAQARLAAEEMASVTGARGEVAVVVRADFVGSDATISNANGSGDPPTTQFDGITTPVAIGNDPVSVEYSFALDEFSATPSNTKGVDTQPADDESQLPTLAEAAPALNGADQSMGSASRSTVSRRVAVQVTQPAQLTLGFAKVDVSVARWLTTTLAALAGVMSVMSLIASANAKRGGEAVWIASRYRSLLVPVHDLPNGRDRNAVEVGSFDALRSMSTAADQLIMVETTTSGVSYYVLDGPVTYRYRANPRASATATATATATASGDSGLVAPGSGADR